MTPAELDALRIGLKSMLILLLNNQPTPEARMRVLMEFEEFLHDLD